MNSPNPLPPAPSPDPSPLPSAGAAASATGLSVVLGYLANVAAAKYNVPLDVVGGLMGLIFTGGTALWHRLTGK